MKRLIIALVFLAAVLPLFGQDNSGKDLPDIYYINVPVVKVYPSGKGYIVQYLRNTGKLATVGLPNEWFIYSQNADKEPQAGTAAASRQGVAAGKAEIISLPRGKNWPTLTVFYKNGEFSHVRLYVHREKSHQTWGNIPQGADTSRYSKYFEDTETIKIEY